MPVPVSYGYIDLSVSIKMFMQKTLMIKYITVIRVLKDKVTR